MALLEGFQLGMFAIKFQKFGATEDKLVLKHLFGSLAPFGSKVYAFLPVKVCGHKMQFIRILKLHLLQ